MMCTVDDVVRQLPSASAVVLEEASEIVGALHRCSVRASMDSREYAETLRAAAQGLCTYLESMGEFAEVQRELARRLNDLARNSYTETWLAHAREDESEIDKQREGAEATLRFAEAVEECGGVP